ncbi:MAG: L-serine ammonia-lyase [Alcaligenaceae bacterium]|nr:L-serine ammonia-lyase [Alcaligenaceae bacterium]
MKLGIFDIFKIGVGPSSSHTVGPMVASAQFIHLMEQLDILPKITQVKINLYGSLGATGRGHATDLAVLVGLTGHFPHLVDPNDIPKIMRQAQEDDVLHLLNKKTISFNYHQDLKFLGDTFLARHPNAMSIEVLDAHKNSLYKKNYYSIGGGFIIDDDTGTDHANDSDTSESNIPYPFVTSKDLFSLCEKHQLTVAQLMMANELADQSEIEVRKGILALWEAMSSCIDRGCQQTGFLPGPMKVKRRANELLQKLESQVDLKYTDPLMMMDWVNLYAMAVNEENASGGRMVTAPTNGAAGIIPAVLKYYIEFVEGANDQGIIDFLLTAAAIGILYKLNASISGAEVGCQGEVGVACSMAAGALTAVTGGTLTQIENAAEIGMEHNLGMTCDPIGGLVQIPCIERNAMGSMKAINASRLALRGDGSHYVSLDQVMATMKQTGLDMQSKYKETSLGGLAIHVVQC